MAALLPSMLRILVLLFGAYLLVGLGVFVAQRSLLYHPTHLVVESVLQPWRVDGAYWGHTREVAEPREVWLVCHGNGGQAAHRDYLLGHFADDVSVYVLEYPGYGDRPGQTTAENINAVTRAAWAELRARHPGLPMGVLGESIGGGPAALLAQEANPPEQIVLLVPFDQLHRVAGAHYWWLPVKWLMRDQWDNVAALRDYRGEVVIQPARDDEIIPLEHARALAAALPSARWVEMAGGHNSWEWDGTWQIEP
jgi:acetyl esterase/lipase